MVVERTVMASFAGGLSAHATGDDFVQGAFYSAIAHLSNYETSRKRNEVTYGEVRSHSIDKNGNAVAGLADAKESLASACTKNGGGCAYVDGSKSYGLDKQAWEAIQNATGGMDLSGGGNVVCIGDASCTLVHSAKTYINGSPQLVKRPSPLSLTGTVQLQGSINGDLEIRFYFMKYKGWLTRDDYLR